MLNWFASMLKGRSSEEGRLSTSLPAGERVYAIGDIHGRRDLLEELLVKIMKDALGYKGKVTLVCIGDYIDRGPDSKGVIELLLHKLPAGWNKVFLRGNHEQAMLDFLKEPKTRGEWLAWGGIQALESYGVAPYGARGLRDPEALAAEIEVAFGEAAGHRAFLESTVLYHTLGNYAFVHAGVRPGVPIAKQMDDDLLFIREDFLGRAHHLPQRVVFGHTILAEPLITDDRIGLDTGAFQTGVLTAVKLEGDDVSIFQTGKAPK